MEGFFLAEQGQTPIEFTCSTQPVLSICLSSVIGPELEF